MSHCLPESIPSLEFNCVMEVISEIRNPADWKATAKKAAWLLVCAIDAVDGPQMMMASRDASSKSIAQLCDEVEASLPAPGASRAMAGGVQIWIGTLIELLLKWLSNRG